MMTLAPEKLPAPMDIYADRQVPVAGGWQSLRDGLFRARLLFDSATGRLEGAADRLAQSIDWSQWREGRPTVLCLERATFSKDIEELQARCDLNFVTMSATAGKSVQERWVPPEWQMQSYFTKFFSDELAAFRPHLERFGEVLLKKASAHHPIDAILAANTDYWQDEALRRAAATLGIPFLVLCRENYTIKQDQANVLRHYSKAGFRYSGTAVAVYSETTRTIMREMGAFPEDGIWVTGAPRFDRWRDVRQVPAETRDCVTLLSYAYPIYEAMDNFREAAAIFAEKAAKRDDLRFVLKLKKENESTDAEALCPSLKGSRVEMTADWPLFDLLPRSRAVVGCNSLAVAEALLTNSAVIVPAWHDALSNSATCLYHYSEPTHRKCIYFPRSAEEFSTLLDLAVRGELPAAGTLEERQACFREHLHYDAAASSSAMVERFIRHYVDQARSAS